MSTRAAALAGTDHQWGEAGAVDADKQAEDFVRLKARSRRARDHAGAIAFDKTATVHQIEVIRLHAR